MSSGGASRLGTTDAMSAIHCRSRPIPGGMCIIILLLVVLNGLLAMSELAIVSSRRTRLEGDGAGRAARRPDRARSRRRSGQVPLDRAERHHPDRDRLRRLFRREPRRARPRSASPCSACPARPRQTLGFSLVIILTTYVSLVIGELVPKQIALRSPEPIAVVVAAPMRWLSRADAPFAWLLDRRAALVFRLMRLNPRDRTIRSPPRISTSSSPRRRPRACWRRASGR